MDFRTRRRLDVALLGIGGLVLAGTTAAAAAIGDAERIGGYWALARVGDDGRTAVTEVIDYDFGPNQRHGIFRDVDDLDPAAPIEVSSPTAPDEFLVQPLSSVTTRIRIGDPVVTISGRHRYRIAYPLDLAPVESRLSWDAVGTGWPVGMSDVEVHLVGATDFSDLQCSAGRAGAWGGCTVTQPRPGHLTVRLDGLDAFEGVTVSAVARAPLAVPPSAPVAPSGRVVDPGTGIVPPALVALGAAGAAAAIGSRLVRRGGRELVWAGGAADAAYGPQLGQDLAVRPVDHAELGRLANIEFTPPKGLTAWQGGVLHREGAGRDQQVAWLLERAGAGEVSIDGVATNGAEPSGTVSLRQLADPADPADRESLRGLFGGRSSVSLGAYDKQFAAGWERLGQRLDRWQRHSPLWDPAGDRRRTEARVLGAFALLAGVLASAGSAVLANRQGSTWLAVTGLGAALAGAGVALLVRSWELRIRTPEGSGLWILTESFRRFIEQSDAQHVEAAARAGQLREYTAWATALGEADHWRDRVAEADLDPSIESGAVGHALVASHLSSAIATAATAPSSGGSGGGGSVGGGGGGGGGGSW